jgi:hypothetical protein
MKTYKEVDRAAKAGERIKIVKPVLSGGYYKKGDELVVKGSVFGADVVVEFSGKDRLIVRAEYVVLEPVKATVKVGDYVRITLDQSGAPAGSIVKVSRVHHGDESPRSGLTRISYVWDGQPGWMSSYYEPASNPPLIVGPDLVAPVSLAGTNPQLEERVSALEKRVAELEAAQPVKQPPKPEPTLTPATPFIPTSKTRADIIQQAKDDVADLLAIGDDSKRDLPDSSPLRNWMYRAEFNVDRDKRCVSVDVYLKHGSHLMANGHAKCDPDDCFNEHIGKAIALRRALGLDVPLEYVKAPQPTEARVGNVVAGASVDGYYNTDKRFTLTKTYGKPTSGFRYAESTADWIYLGQIGRIMDDSVSEV